MWLRTFKNDRQKICYQVIDEPSHKISGGVESPNDKADDISEDFFFVAGIVQDGV
jgi:hypothetical protein